MAKYTYDAGMTDQEKKRARRIQRELDKASGTYVPHAVNRDGVAHITASMATQKVASVASGTVARTETVATSGQWAINDLATLLNLLAAGVAVKAIIHTVAPTVVTAYNVQSRLWATAAKSVALELASDDDDDDDSDDSDDDSQDVQDALAETVALVTASGPSLNVLETASSQDSQDNEATS